MPAWDDYTLKNKPEDGDTLMIKDNSATNKANKRTKFSGLWDWIVDKLAAAVISNLTTSNKTVIGALNELNSKTLSGWKLKEKTITNVEAVNIGGNMSFHTGIPTNNTIPLFFKEIERSGWIYTIWSYSNQYDDWLISVDKTADGVYSGIFYYLEKV